MSWRISIYLLGFFFKKYKNMIPLMVSFNVSTICAYCYYVLRIDWFCYHVSKFSPRRWKILFVHPSVWLLYFYVSLKICADAFLIAIPHLDLSGSNHAHLHKISITIIINLNLSLCFESLLIFTKSISYCSSIWCTTTGFILKLRSLDLYKVHDNWDFNLSSTSSTDIYESCFFASSSSLNFSA